MAKCNSLFQDEQETYIRRQAEKLVSEAGYNINSPDREACIQSAIQEIQDAMQKTIDEQRWRESAHDE